MIANYIILHITSLHMQGKKYMKSENFLIDHKPPKPNCKKRRSAVLLEAQNETINQTY